jgi:hypothetical protein
MRRLHFFFFFFCCYYSLLLLFRRFYIMRQHYMLHEGGGIVLFLLTAMEWNGFDCIESNGVGKGVCFQLYTKRSGATTIGTHLRIKIPPLFSLSYPFPSVLQYGVGKFKKVPRRNLCVRETRPSAHHCLHPNKPSKTLTQRPHFPNHSFLCDSCRLRCNLSNPDLQLHSLL